MAVVVTMPQLGETVTEGTILRWMKQPGDMVAADEVLLEISTDKVDTEIPSPAAGVLSEILVPEGETVEVGTDLAVIGSEGEEPATAPAPEAVEAPISMAPEAPVESAPAGVAEAPAPEPAPALPAAELGSQSGPGPGKRQVLSPVVRKLASASGVDLALVPGTGQGGRITRSDVEAYIAAGVPAPASAPTAPPGEVTAPSAPVAAGIPAAAEAPAAPAAPAAAETPIAPAASAPPSAPSQSQAAGLQAPAGEGVAPPEGLALMAGDRVVELSRLRQRIADNMIKAKQSAAHVWASVEVDYENLERVRRRHKEQWKASEGYSLTYLPFIARAVSDALAAFPVVNSSIYPGDGKAVFHSAINLGIAIDLNQEGLVVGTVRGADGLRVAGLARAIRAVADKARSDQLMPDDVSGSTFSITNPGPFGSFMTAPIINVPNTGILSTDTVTKRPVVVTDEHGNDSISIRHIGYLGLTWNHQAFDGSAAVLFLQRIKHNIETWDWEQELA
ncbi:MAG: 2-oxo acid dehydrogenase subunit E2 [Acidimicrobiia bacterium]|nr:2-oxo acid dehydrogenase subunit E2 [Acidimicrobiia bacterium]NNL12305.1 2-oxo acid dehydrogenase subunit E2 [Acidimicrobiia bacterium]NNL96910.1 2-oxo acid dehydrogenase subunit E2 [Acidimicrobiia bacterium]